MEVLGLKKSPTTVTVNDMTHEFKYDAQTERLSLDKLNVDLVGKKNLIVWK